jgi:hypothetical protein
MKCLAAFFYYPTSMAGIIKGFPYRFKSIIRGELRWRFGYWYCKQPGLKVANEEEFAFEKGYIRRDVQRNPYGSLNNSYSLLPIKGK